MLTGEYRNMIDEKGRLLIPSRLRSSIAGSRLIITRSLEKCLWIMLPSAYENLKSQFDSVPGGMFNERIRRLRRLLISSAIDCEIDKAGRINIPPILREKAGIPVKEDAVIVGVDQYLELWSVENYDAIMDQPDEVYKEDAQYMELKLDPTAKNG